MNIAAVAPAWLVGILLLLLTIAAIEDGWRLRISNILVLGVAATGAAAMFFAGIGWNTWQPLLLMGAILVVGTPLFSAGWMGGGDVKLLAASATWFMLDEGWKWLVTITIIGGMLTLIMLLVRRFKPGESRIALLRRGAGMPYGIAIAIGTAIVVLRPALFDPPRASPLDLSAMPTPARR